MTKAEELETKIRAWHKKMELFMGQALELPEEVRASAYKTRLEGLDLLIIFQTEVNYRKSYGRDYEPELELVREWDLAWLKQRRIELAKLIGNQAN